MPPRFLVDTHILVRWLTEPRRLSRVQERTLESCATRGESIALSDMTLLEIALLFNAGQVRIKADLASLFRSIDSNELFQVLPMTTGIASEAGALVSLRDPADRVIVATARVHRLTLVTSDRLIVESKLIRTLE